MKTKTSNKVVIPTVFLEKKTSQPKNSRVSLLNKLGPKSKKSKVYGLKIDIPDVRDFKKVWTKEEKNNASSLETCDLRNNNMPPVFDQGHNGSCSANAICGAFSYMSNILNRNNPELSRLFLYYNQRSMEGSTRYDSGSQIRTGIKSIKKLGICSESEHPYFLPISRRPSSEAYKNALSNVGVVYERISTDITGFKTAIASGFPVIFGFSVPSYFENEEVSKTGIMPEYNNETIIGGHAAVACGYDDVKKTILVRNSWGSSWGDEGYFHMPYSFIDSSLLSDSWILEIVT